MNVNWRDAILQAQRKIDQVLDINPETVEVEAEDELEPEEEYEAVPKEVVVREPISHPVLNQINADEIQTIVSSDIESIGGHSSGSVSPQELHPTINHDQILDAVTENNSYETIEMLKKEILEYRRANQNLLKSHSTLEQKIEETRFTANQQMTNLLKEERHRFEEEMVQLQAKNNETLKENIALKETLESEAAVWMKTKELLNYFRHQTEMVKHSLTWAENIFKSDMTKFSVDIKNYMESMHKPTDIKVQPSKNSTVVEIKEREKYSTSTQTECDSFCNENDSNEITTLQKTPTRKVTFEDPKNNVNYLLSIIESLENEKQFWGVEKRRSKTEIERLNSQLSETLIMHGEKLEQLEELKIDNEDLKEMLKQQALQLTEHTDTSN